MNHTQVEQLLTFAQGFVEAQPTLRALALCGSWARGNPRPDSDLDLLIVAENPQRWRRRQQWLRDLTFETAGFHYARHRTATYGVVWSAHVELEPAAELELTFASPTWASTDPIDPGTHFIISDAFRVLVDKDGLLGRLLEVISHA
jgi:predicted nucleotidyltransferase